MSTRRTPSKQRLAHVAARARWAVSEIGAIARRGYAARREFQYLRYLLERGYRFKVSGLPPRDEILERLVKLQPTCTARWGKVKAERKRRRQRHRNRKGANMTDVLKDAEGRVPAYAATRQAEEAEAVRMARDDIGPANYEAAKQQLPILEKGIRDFQVWMEKITGIARQTGSYPDTIRQAVENIAKSCEAGPRQLRAGIAMYDGLEFKRDLAWQQDRRQVDINKRAWYISETRRLLRSFDGLLSYMRSQRARAEQYIRQAEWPRRPGQPSATLVAAREPERGPTELPVETEFEMGGKLFGRRPGA